LDSQRGVVTPRFMRPAFFNLKALAFFCLVFQPQGRSIPCEAESAWATVGSENQILADFKSGPEEFKLREKAFFIKSFAAGRKFNRQICFLVDMQLLSGQNRFFVYQINGDSVLCSGLVAHGHGGGGFSPKPRFSNAPSSYCTAIGLYRVAQKYSGNYGFAYKLYGLDSTNSNAFKRNIVLHAYPCVPERETYPYPICNSSGCPMVSPGFLRQLMPLIDGSVQPILLWIFE
jgi:hypothetical protein